MLVFAFARFLVRLPKKRRRMNRREDSWGKLGRQYFSQPDQRMVCPRRLRSRLVVRRPTSSAHALDPGQTRFGSRAYANGMRCTRLPLRERRLDLMCLAAEL